jgi:hypothetical protein
MGKYKNDGITLSGETRALSTNTYNLLVAASKK